MHSSEKIQREKTFTVYNTLNFYFSQRVQIFIFRTQKDHINQLRRQSVHQLPIWIPTLFYLINEQFFPNLSQYISKQLRSVKSQFPQLVATKNWLHLRCRGLINDKENWCSRGGSCFLNWKSAHDYETTLWEMEKG